MRRRSQVLLLTCCVALFAGACAKKELVQPGEPLVSVVAAPVTDAPQQQAEPSHSEAVKPEAAPQAPASPSTEAALPDALEPVPAAELGAALESIYFGFDSHLLSAEARDTLAKNARFIAAREEGVRIAGHCDERGSDDYNLALSERRAVSARDYLVGLGVPRERLTVIGYGKERPALAGHDEAAWARNRRAEFEPIKP